MQRANTVRGPVNHRHEVNHLLTQPQISYISVDTRLYCWFASTRKTCLSSLTRTVFLTTGKSHLSRPVFFKLSEPRWWASASFFEPFTVLLPTSSMGPASSLGTGNGAVTWLTDVLVHLSGNVMSRRVAAYGFLPEAFLVFQLPIFEWPLWDRLYRN